MSTHLEASAALAALACSPFSCTGRSGAERVFGAARRRDPLSAHTHGWRTTMAIQLPWRAEAAAAVAAGGGRNGARM